MSRTMRTLRGLAFAVVTLSPVLARADDPDAADPDASVLLAPDAAPVEPEGAVTIAPVAIAPVAPPPAVTAPAPVAIATPRRVHRRVRHRRGTGLLRARGATVTLGWRYTGIPTEGHAGPTHGFSLDFLPLARSRGAARYVRLDLGGEFALRFARPDATDTITWLHAAVGAQYPTRYVTPFATMGVWGGFATRYRFFTPLFDGAWALGLEGGADLRIAAFFGITASAGVGHVVIGDQWSWGGWIRAGIAFF